MIKISDTEYFSDNKKIRFLNMDCNLFMAGCKEKEFELACVDPPYGLGESVINSGGRFKRYRNKNGNWDMSTPKKEYFEQLFRLSKNQIIWGGNYFNLPPNKCFLIWDKEQPEGISFSMCEYAWVSFDKVAQIYRKRTQCQELRFHPTQKPIAIYRWIFKNYAKPTDHIFDSHGGSMSSAIAAHMEGLRMTIIELDEEYFAKSIKRFATYESQQTIKFD